VNVHDDLLALARQLTASFAQLQTSGIDASQLASAGDTPGSLAQRDLLSGDGTTGAAAALAQDGSLLTQAGLARIGVDLRNEDVDAATLQAAYAADSAATLDALAGNGRAGAGGGRAGPAAGRAGGGRCRGGPGRRGRPCSCRAGRAGGGRGAGNRRKRRLLHRGNSNCSSNWKRKS
jgi:hypothetical protein